MNNSSSPGGLRIFLLGGFAVRAGQHVIDDGAWRLRKARNLMKLLTLAPGRRLHREQVISSLWPDLAPEQALNNLHQTMHIARRALSLAPANGEGPDGRVLHIRAHVVKLEPPTPLWVDVEAFEEAAARASGTGDVRSYETALHLYTGELLPEDRYEEWTLQRRETLARQHLALLFELAQLHEHARDLPNAVECLQRVLATDATHEDAHTGLMRLYELMGQRQAALRQFHDLKTALKEIDVDPQPASVELHNSILSGNLAGLASSSSTVSRGPHRRHGLPLSGVHREVKRERPGNLPASLSTFIGREHDLTVLQDLLAEARLLTLTGPGGSGKTRLGIELGAALRSRFLDGVWWVDLQALMVPVQVAQAAATILGVRERPGQTLETALSDSIADRRMLLVLDNCEHLLNGCAALSEALLGSCPHLRMLTTSREHLGVAGERRWPVSPLTVPPKNGQFPIEDLRNFEAVRLFEVRSRAVSPGFTLTSGNAAAVAEICRRLDGLPLAIELVAAYSHVLSLEQVLDRLTDPQALLSIHGHQMSRYRSLGDVIDWSYRLLNESERTLFRRLAVFAGGFTLEAAGAVCAPSPADAEGTLDLLASLVDKSLVTVDERPDGSVRYGLLETIREYDQETLASTGQEAEEIRDRHLSWALALVKSLEDVESRRSIAERVTASLSDTIATEYDNICAAMGWALKGGDAEKGFRLSYAMSQFWHVRGRYSETRRWLSSFLERSGKVSPLLRARALHALGRHSWQLGETSDAVSLIEEALRTFRAMGETYQIGLCLLTLGNITDTLGEHTRARTFYEESGTIFRELRVKWALGGALEGLGSVQQAQGDYAAADAHFKEGLAIHREIGADLLLTDPLLYLAGFYLATGRHAAARPLFEECLDLSRRSNFMTGIAGALNGLAAVAMTEGVLSKADSLFEEALRLSKQSGWKTGVARALGGLARIARLQNRSEEARSMLKSALHELQATGRRPHIVVSLHQFAQLACDTDQLPRAARLFGVAEALREEMGTVMAPADRAEYERDMTDLRVGLSEDDVTQAWAEGRAMTTDEAVNYALCDDGL